MSYGNKKQVNLEFNEAVEKVRNGLKEEGFGVLTEIDVKAVLKKKLGIDYENYIILGACNPQFAYKALQSEKEIGLLLPCNIIVYIEDNKTYISAVNPMEAMSVVKNSELEEIAKEISEKLNRVMDSL